MGQLWSGTGPGLRETETELGYGNRFDAIRRFLSARAGQAASTAKPRVGQSVLYIYPAWLLIAVKDAAVKAKSLIATFGMNVMHLCQRDGVEQVGLELTCCAPPNFPRPLDPGTREDGRRSRREHAMGSSARAVPTSAETSSRLVLHLPRDAVHAGGITLLQQERKLAATSSAVTRVRPCAGQDSPVLLSFLSR